MLKLQRILLNVLFMALLILALALAVQNLAVLVPVQILTWTVPSVSLGGVLGVAVLLTAAAMLLKLWERMLVLNQAQRRAGRELERREVSQEEAQAQVKVLENKVQTLEKALREALKSGEPRA